MSAICVCHRHEPIHMQSCLRLLSTVSDSIDLYSLNFSGYQKNGNKQERHHSFAQEKANNRIKSLFLLWVFTLHILPHTSSELKRKQKHRKQSFQTQLYRFIIGSWVVSKLIIGSYQIFQILFVQLLINKCKLSFSTEKTHVLILRIETCLFTELFLKED